MCAKILIPRQPYQALLAERYWKKVVLNYGISHFYECCIGDGVTEIATSVPDGCIDIMFYWNKDLKEIGADVLGTLLRPHAVSVHAGCCYFGVRFLPGQPLLFESLPFSELVEQAVPLSKNEENLALLERIIMAQNFDERIEAFMKIYLPKYIVSVRDASAEIINRWMLQKILEEKGNVRVRELAESMGYSERYASRIFAQYSGITPKKFCRIIRFQNVLQEIEEQYMSNHSFWEYNENGYYDEAHLIHDFKEFCGKSPMRFLGEMKNERLTERLKIL